MVEDVIAVIVRLCALLLTHRADLERAADPKSLSIYSILYLLFSSFFSFYSRSLEHELSSPTRRPSYVRTFADAPRGSGKSCRSKVSTHLLSFARAIRWYLQIEFS